MSSGGEVDKGEEIFSGSFVTHWPPPHSYLRVSPCICGNTSWELAGMIAWDQRRHRIGQWTLTCRKYLFSSSAPTMCHKYTEPQWPKHVRVCLWVCVWVWAGVWRADGGNTEHTHSGLGCSLRTTALQESFLGRGNGHSFPGVVFPGTGSTQACLDSVRPDTTFLPWASLPSSWLSDPPRPFTSKFF